MLKNKLMGLFLFVAIGISTLYTNTSINSSNNNNEVNTTNTLEDDNDYDYGAVWGQTTYSSSLDGGTGTVSDPYEISSGNDWGYLLHYYNSDCTVTTADPITYYELTNDIHLTSFPAIMCYMPTNMVLLGNGYTVTYGVINPENVTDKGLTCGIFGFAQNITIENTNFIIDHFNLSNSTLIEKNCIRYGSLCVSAFNSTFYNVDVNLKNESGSEMKLLTDLDSLIEDELLFGNLFGCLVSSNVLHCFYTDETTFTFAFASNTSECYIGSLAGEADGDVVVIDTEIEKASILIKGATINQDMEVTNSAIIGYIDFDFDNDCNVKIINSIFAQDTINCNGGEYANSAFSINLYYVGYVDEATIKLSYVCLSNLNDFDIVGFDTYYYDTLKFDDLDSSSLECVCLGYNSQSDYDAFKITDYPYEYITGIYTLINSVKIGLFEFNDIFSLFNYNVCYQLDYPYATYFKDANSSLDYSSKKLSGVAAPFTDGAYDFYSETYLIYCLFYETGTEGNIVYQPYGIGISLDHIVTLASAITIGENSLDVVWYEADVVAGTSIAVNDTSYHADSPYDNNTIFVARLSDGGSGDDEQPIYVYPDTTYNIIYEVNGGTINESEYPLTYKTGDKVILPSDVTKEGYIFVGWYLDSRLTKKMIQSISTLAQGTINVYAKYIAKDSLNDGEFYVNIEVPGHSEDIITGTYKTGDVIDLPTFTQEGYTLIGYRDNPYNEGELVSKVTVGTSNLFHTYYPVWAKEVIK
ncbi:MAG: InlB B-repeat-containing protein [Bacilli bacterium]